MRGDRVGSESGEVSSISVLGWQQWRNSESSTKILETVLSKKESSTSTPPEETVEEGELKTGQAELGNDEEASVESDTSEEEEEAEATCT